MTQQTAKVVVYRTGSCPYCIAAAQLLDARGIDYDEIALDGRPDRGQVTSAILPGHRTVPLILIDDEPIGGFDELRALDASGSLRARVFADS